MKDYKDEIQTLLETNDEAWEALDGDGHSIMLPSFYVDLGWPEEFIASLVTVYKSDTSSIKSTIFDHDGNILESLEGIDSLSFHREIAWMFDCDADARISGRGSQARDIVHKLAVKFGRIKEAV